MPVRPGATGVPRIAPSRRPGRVVPGRHAQDEPNSHDRTLTLTGSCHAQTVVFNGDGSKLAVSTWGVAHFDTPDADLTLQKPGRLYIYGFSGGTLSQTGMYEEPGVSGNIGVSWSPNNQYVYMTNFNLHASKEDNGVTVHDGTTAAKVQNFGTSDRNDEACWTWVSFDKRRLFTASFTSNAVSTFDIGGDGRLSISLRPNSVVRRAAPRHQGDAPDVRRVPVRCAVVGREDGYAAGVHRPHGLRQMNRASRAAPGVPC